MSIKEVTACDNCGAFKGEVNGWFCLLTGEAVIPKSLGWAPSEETGVKAFAFARMHDVPDEHIRGLRHYCSAACITKVFSLWLETGDIPGEKE